MYVQSSFYRRKLTAQGLERSRVTSSSQMQVHTVGERPMENLSRGHDERSLTYMRDSKSRWMAEDEQTSRLPRIANNAQNANACVREGEVA